MARIMTMLLALFLSHEVWGADLSASDLQGTWTAVAAERDGASASELVGHRIIFTGDFFQISSGESVLFGGGFTVDAAQKPAHLDFAITDGSAKGQSWLGIFKIDNGRLIICDTAPDPAAARPREFGAPKGSAYVCLTFAR